MMAKTFINFRNLN